MHDEATTPNPPAAGSGATVTTAHPRLVRHAELAPCRNAFVDSRSPGSDAKENFTIIGPGVSENPSQHVHIPEPHGFNIGGARQPPGCLNSQHSHLTAEVFVVHSGRWRFRYGVDGGDGTVELDPGDTISVPPMMFRGFENVGEEAGFLFAVLGGDDPGHVTWAPSVFTLAQEHGLVLLEGGRLVDTSIGERVPQGARYERAPTPERIAELATPPAAWLARCVARAGALVADANSPFAGAGIADAPVIVDDAGADPDLGPNDAPGDEPGPIRAPEDGAIHGWWPHGFEIRRVSLDAHAAVAEHAGRTPEVLFVQSGALRVTLPDGAFEMGPGDTASLPRDALRSWRNVANGLDGATVAFLVRGSDA